MRNLLLALFVIIRLFLNAQDSTFYYYNGDKFYLKIDYSRISVVSEGNFNFDKTINSFNSTFFYIQNVEKCNVRQNVVPIDQFLGSLEDKDIFLTEIQFNDTLTQIDYYNVIQQFSQENNILKINPTYIVSGKRLGLSNNFYVKLFREEDKNTLLELATQYSIEVLGYNEFMPLWFTLSCGKQCPINSVEAANLFYETSLFESTEPEFLYHNLLTSNDPNFSSQWGLKNTGQYGGFVGVDIKAEQAWAISTGSNVRVAIFDHGFERDHPDLIMNNEGTGYDATTNTTPAQVRGSHGVVCAGIVGAKQNNSIGISGVAPDSKLMSISINLLFSDTPQQLANGFNWAWQNGADVISNSWGGYTPSSIINNAITNTLSQGRNGKGTIVVFSSGNDDNTAILYPAINNPDILVVGAISPCGERKSHSSCDGECWGSCYGSQLDVVAPGVLISTTDRQGTNGYNPYEPLHEGICGNGDKISSDYINEDYTVWFNGTSAACPHVAGVAALVLSNNPNLTAKQVRDIIENTAEKVRTDLYDYSMTTGRTNGTWNNQMGYGLVNACTAVLITSLGIEPISNTTITSNTTFFSDKFVSGNLIIESGITLTITSKIRFADNAKVIIKPGAKLIINGGILTSVDGCGTFWQGVEVWGTSNQHQYPLGSPTYQGYLMLINGGTIENALNGARNWKPNDFNKIGGVIVSNGGIFKNNRRAVEFMSYENFNPTNPNTKRNNLSSFTNTDFIWNNDFIAGYTYDALVTMWQVYGITYNNCHFSNLMGSKNINNPSQNRAIYSIDAGYTIGAGCSSSFYPCPTGDLLESTFSGFLNAIVATGSGTTKTISVSQATFSNNLTAVDIDDFDNISINRNTISIGSAGYSLIYYTGTGINIKNSTGYIVEENTITTTLPGITNTNYGIKVHNSGTANNRLYKNTMTGLTYGQYLTGINRGKQNGLQFLCNTFNTNSKAVYIGTSSITHGIRGSQGEYSPAKSAGNIFSSNTNSIYNVSTNLINYYHNGGNTFPTSNFGNVSPSLVNQANTCPSSFGGVISFGMETDGALDSLEIQQQNLQATYDELNYMYLSQLDDGNTLELKAKIENTWSEDVWVLRENLLEQSPYLSMEILLETTKLGVLPNAMLIEICLANPDATKEDYFLDKLNEATNGTFPEYMKEYIRANDKKTVRTQLESQIASLYSEISSTKNFIKSIKATEKEYTYADRFTLSANGKELSDKIGIIDFFLENKQSSKADSVLQTIYENKNLEFNLELIEDFDKYINFRENLGNRTLTQLNENEINFLQELAISQERVGGYARNILCFFYQICYEDEFEEKNKQKTMLQQEQSQNVLSLKTVLYSMTIYPNPAKEYVNLQWEILDKLKDCYYQIVDLNGIILSEGIILQNKGELTLDTRNFRNGIYMISLFNGNELKTTKKLVVDKMK